VIERGQAVGGVRAIVITGADAVAPIRDLQRGTACELPAHQQDGPHLWLWRHVTWHCATHIFVRYRSVL